MAKKAPPTQVQRQARVVLGNIDKYQTIADISNSTLMSVMGISDSTLRRRRKMPEEFTLNELLRFAKFVKIPLNELLV